MDDGMMPAWQANRRAWPAVIRSPRGGLGDACLIAEGVEVEHHHDRVCAGGFGGPVGRQGKPGTSYELEISRT